MSFLEIRSINNIETPTEMYKYKNALQLNKLINTRTPEGDWIDLNFQQTFNNQMGTFNFVKMNNFKIGNNSICNRLYILNNKIEYR